MGSRPLTVANRNQGGSGVRVLVTGAAQGIGRATCLRLAEASLRWRNAPARIVAVDLSEPHLAELEELLRGKGAEVHALPGDVTDTDLPARAVAFADRTLGGLDCLVSNAGFARHAPLVDLATDQWDLVFQANVRAPWLLAKHAHRLLRASQGSMVILGSISGINPQIGLGAYSPSKAAAIMLARQLAVEWAGSGIRVNAVSPGPTHTATTGRFYANEEILRERIEKMPVGRIGQAEDIAAAIEFLCGPDATYVNGENIVVDGALSTAAMLEFAKTARPRPAEGE